MKRFLLIFICVLLCFSLSLPVFAADTKVWDFALKTEEVHLGAYDSFITYQNSTRWYVCYFNSSDLTSIAEIDDTYFQLSFSAKAKNYKDNYNNTVSHLLLTKYSQLFTDKSQYSTLVTSGYPESVTSIKCNKSTQYLFSNNEAVRSFCVDNDINLVDEYRAGMIQIAFKIAPSLKTH